MPNFTPSWDRHYSLEKNVVNENVTCNSDDVQVDFSFFYTDNADKIKVGTDETKKTSSKRKSKPKIAIDGQVLPDRDVVMNPIPGSGIAEVDYARTYTETNNLIRGAIIQTDELSSAIKGDIDAIRASKTIKNKYTYITNLTASASSLISTKIAAIKELNSTITQSHNLELSRFKTLKVDQKDDNDDMKMMDIYSAFVNTPIGSYTPPAPSIQDITLGINGKNPSINPIEMINNNSDLNNLTPEQNRMRLESDRNVQTVVRYDQSTGQRCFDVIDKTTGMSIPNYPRPDSFLLEDTTIDVHSGIARNRNINTVWPLLLDGSDSMTINEY